MIIGEPAEDGSKYPTAPRGSDHLLVVGLISLVLSTAFSRFSAVALGLALVGVVLSGPSVPRGLRAPWAASAAIVAVFWLAYGAAIGSLPPLGEIGDWFLFLETEGRALLPLFALVAVAGLRSRSAIDKVVDTSKVVLVGILTIGLVLHYAGLSVTGTRTYTAFTSGHHVSGFLSSAVLLILAVRGLPVRAGMCRWVAAAVMLLAVVESGSRASLMGLAMVAIYLVLRQRTPTRLVKYGVLVFVALSTTIVISDRARNTMQAAVSAQFLDSAAEAFETSDPSLSSTLAQNREQVNAIKRFGLWGQTVEEIATSPLIGMGMYRFNDEHAMRTGIEDVISVVVVGERVHDEFTAHNMYLHLLAEGGVVGLVLYLWPWIRAARQERRAVGDQPAERMGLLSRSLLVFSFGVAFSSGALLGAGLGVIAALLVGGGAQFSRLQRQFGTTAGRRAAGRGSELAPTGNRG